MGTFRYKSQSKIGFKALLVVFSVCVFVFFNWNYAFSQGNKDKYISQSRVGRNTFKIETDYNTQGNTVRHEVFQIFHMLNLQ